MGFLDWLRPNKRARGSLSEVSCVVEFDDKEIRYTRVDGDRESVEWDDLKCILLRNTDEGPFSPDVFWLLLGTKGGCVIPQGAIGEDDLLKRLQDLPGFNNEVVVASATCINNRDFVCWEKAKP